MPNFDDFIEQVRDANPIEDIIQEDGLKLRGHGRLKTCTKHDSLKVRTDMQRAFWYSQNWNGDVFGWIMRAKGCDFNTAVEILAKRAHIEMPRFNQVNEGEVRRRRATADVFSVAANVFQRWLTGDAERGVKSDAKALEYAQGRGWSEETLRLAMTGFSGRKEDWQVKDMAAEFQLYGFNLRSPAAVAVLGFHGDVDAWAKEQGIRDDEDFDEEWIAKGRIHGLVDTPGLIYAHQHRGGVKYLSRRQLPGFDTIKEKDGKKARDWKAFNPYKLLAGAKQPYFNHMHRIDRLIVLVEGQGDAITWGQWGYGAMAFCGLLGDVDQLSMEDTDAIRRLASLIKKHPNIYLCLDADEAGQNGIKLAAKLLGPKIQIVRMSRTWSREDAKSVESAEGNTDAG